MEVYICRIKDIKEKLKEFKHLNEYVKNSNTKHYKLSEKQLEKKGNMDPWKRVKQDVRLPTCKTRWPPTN